MDTTSILDSPENYCLVVDGLCGKRQTCIPTAVQGEMEEIAWNSVVNDGADPTAVGNDLRKNSLQCPEGRQRFQSSAERG